MEFHAVYELTCDAPQHLSPMQFPYFDRFAGAQKLDMQIISDKGARGATVTREAPRLDLPETR